MSNSFLSLLLLLIFTQFSHTIHKRAIKSVTLADTLLVAKVWCGTWMWPYFHTMTRDCLNIEMYELYLNPILDKPTQLNLRAYTENFPSKHTWVPFQLYNSHRKDDPWFTKKTQVFNSNLTQLKTIKCRQRCYERGTSSLWICIP